MPPANTSFATAVDLGTLPADVTQTDIHDSGTGLNYTVYYKFTAPVDALVIGAWGFSTIADAYRTVLRPYDNTQAPVLGIAGTNVPIQFPVVGGQQYYLEFSKTNNTAPTSLRIRVEVAPLGNIVNGNICVNDDTLGFPTAILSHLTDYTVVNFRLNTASGEEGDRLATGYICLEDRDTLEVAFYLASDWSQIVRQSLGPHNHQIRSNNETNHFWVGLDDSPSKVACFSNLGVQVGATHTLSTNRIFALCTNATETVLYYSVFGVNSPIKRWDLVNDVALSDIVAGNANETINDLLMMPDGTIISVHENLASDAVECRNYTTAGVLLHTYTCPANKGSFSKLAYSGDSTSFWSWTHDTFTRSRFQNIRISDGVVLTDRLQLEYEGGVMNSSETASPLSRFGNSFSCPFWIFAAPAPPGMFIVTPNKRTDHDGNTDVKIPNPTFKTGLMP